MWEDDPEMQRMLAMATHIWAARFNKAILEDEGMTLTPMDVKVLCLVINQMAEEAVTFEMKATMATATPEDFKD